ncbi:MAG: hypothetical protein ACO36A_01575 [Ilumatobacteraceae bacterium]
MISPTLETLRLFLHVLAASVWVGGQIVLAGLVPRVRAANREVLPVIAAAFARIAWPAFAVAVVTGVWNLVAVDPTAQGDAYVVTLFVKLLLVGTAAAATLVHSAGRSKLALALGGAVGLLTSLGVFWLGVVLSANA